MTLPIDNPAIDTVEKLAYEQAVGKIQVYDAENSAYYRAFKVSKSYINLINLKHFVKLECLN